jgi:hypothetical protein
MDSTSLDEAESGHKTTDRQRSPFMLATTPVDSPTPPCLHIRQWGISSGSPDPHRTETMPLDATRWGKVTGGLSRGLPLIEAPKTRFSPRLTRLYFFRRNCEPVDPIFCPPVGTLSVAGGDRLDANFLSRVYVMNGMALHGLCGEPMAAVQWWIFSASVRLSVCSVARDLVSRIEAGGIGFITD